MQKFLLTWFKKKSVGEKKLFTSFFLRDLGRNDGTIPSRGQNKRGAGLLSHDVTKDAAPCPSPAWLPGSLGRTRERVDSRRLARSSIAQWESPAMPVLVGPEFFFSRISNGNGRFPLRCLVAQDSGALSFT